MNTPKNQQIITPFLWFDGKAEEAMNFYTSIFPNSQITLNKRWGANTPFPDIKEGQIMAGSITLDGVELQLFDAGPMFKINPSISFFAVMETEQEVKTLWEKLSDGGNALMPLDKYPWSELYGWAIDRFGVSWQVFKGQLKDVRQRISPSLMFSGANKGRAEDAYNFYMSVFENSALDGVDKYGPESGPNEGMVAYAQCKILGQTFMFMDSGVDNDFPFNEAISLFVSCKNQQEIDYYWDKLTADGGEESQCGWLRDKFGVSWQIVPESFNEMIASDNEAGLKNVMNAVYQMKKLDVAKLEEAYKQPVWG